MIRPTGLLQHVHNPIDWYPWSEGAFERARQKTNRYFLVAAIVLALVPRL